jgi:ABC-type branched-subunit amino acid transport system substrate-binding protein
MTQYPAGGGQPYEGDNPAERADPAAGYPQYGIEPQSGAGQPPAGDPGWGPPPPQGYPSNPGQGYPPNPGQGYPPGYPPNPGQGYPPNPHQGYPGPPPVGQPQPGQPGPGQPPQPGPLPPTYYGAEPQYPPGYLPPIDPPKRGGGRTLAIVAGVVVLVLVLCGVGGTYLLHRADSGTGSGSPQPAAVAKCASGTLAVLGATTGKPDELGPATVNMAKLAADEYGAAHPGCTIAVKAFDSDGDQAKALVLAKQIIADPTVLGVIGPLYSKEALAASPVLDKAGVPMVNPTVSTVSLGTAGLKHFHRTVGTDADSGEAIAKYIKGVNPAAKAYVIDDGSNYAIHAAEAARVALGTLAVGSAVIKEGQTAFGSLAKSIVESGANVIAFAGFSGEAAALRKAVDAAGGSKIDFVGGPALLDTIYVTETGDEGKDTIVVCACMPGTGLPDAFRDKLTAKSTTKPGIYVGEAYDATNALLAGLAVGKSTRTQLNTFLGTYSATGVTGPIAFRAGGNLRGQPPQWYFVTGTDGFFGKSPVQ